MNVYDLALCAETYSWFPEHSKINNYNTAGIAIN